MSKIFTYFLLIEGTKWIQMVGEVSMLSVGTGDQVIAIRSVMLLLLVL
jgi:hypothetical protein